MPRGVGDLTVPREGTQRNTYGELVGRLSTRVNAHFRRLRRSRSIWTPPPSFRLSRSDSLHQSALAGSAAESQGYPRCAASIAIRMVGTVERDSTLREVLEGLLGSRDTLIGSGDDLSGFLDDLGRPELPHDLLKRGIVPFFRLGSASRGRPPRRVRGIREPSGGRHRERVSGVGLALFASVPSEVPDENPDDGATVVQGGDQIPSTIAIHRSSR